MFGFLSRERERKTERLKKEKRGKKFLSGWNKFENNKIIILKVQK